MIAAPFLISPTGGYSKDETACPGYSSPLLASGDPKDGRVLMLSGTANAHGKCDIRFGTITLPAR
jgi:hypothetical protein